LVPTEFQWDRTGATDVQTENYTWKTKRQLSITILDSKFFPFFFVTTKFHNVGDYFWVLGIPVSDRISVPIFASLFRFEPTSSERCEEVGEDLVKNWLCLSSGWFSFRDKCALSSVFIISPSSSTTSKYTAVQFDTLDFHGWRHFYYSLVSFWGTRGTKR
jgi:hypothetical protein